MKVFRRRTWWIIFVVLAVIVPFLAVWVDQLNAETKPEESAEWFERMATVHAQSALPQLPYGRGFPGPGRRPSPSRQHVIRPASQRESITNEFGKGADASPCIVCHASVNTADGRQPGAPIGVSRRPIWVGTA